MTALTGAELLDWLERTTAGWRDLVRQHPEVLLFPCSTRETQTVAELLGHIVAVELRYAELLRDLPESPQEPVLPGEGDAIFAVHARAMHLLQPVLQNDEPFWHEAIDFQTRSAGRVRTPRRVILVHLAMHSIRHYAQLATLVRERGVAPGWPMDYLFMFAG